MSREIKFRGMTFNGKWIIGDLNQLQTSTFIHWNNNGMRTADEVNIKTVGQFTGLHDKNGVEIYENDIIKGKEWERGKSHRHIGVVKYVGSSFESVGIGKYLGISGSVDGSYEVIGNIHERSEDNDK